MKNKRRNYLTGEDLAEYEKAWGWEDSGCLVRVGDKEYVLKEGDELILKVKQNNLEALSPKIYSSLQNLSPVAHWLWWELVKLRDHKTNIVSYAVKNEEAFTELHFLDLIKRTAPQQYIINPEILFTTATSLGEIALQIWNSIK